jgi:hypothetical protein
MKVLITGCSSEGYWYNDKIGEVFNIAHTDNLGFTVLDAFGADYNGFIKREDCHVIQSIGTVLMELEKNGGELEWWSMVSKKWMKFEKGNRIALTDILRMKPVEQPQYCPYTFEEAKEVFTKDAWVIDKQIGELLMVFRIREDGVFLASCPKTEYDLLLSNFTHLDGTPCGVKIN